MSTQLQRGGELLKEAQHILETNGRAMVIEWYAELPTEDQEAIKAVNQRMVEVLGEAMNIFRDSLTQAVQVMAEYFNTIAEEMSK